MILLLSENNEPNTASVIEILNKLEKPWFRLNGESFPSQINFHLSKNKEESFVVDESGANKVNQVFLKDVKSVWFRRAGKFRPSDKIEGRVERQFCFYECVAAYEGLSEQLSSARWMNDLWNEKSADNSLFQLRAAEQAELDVPDYIVSQDIVQSERFFDKYNGEVITKGLSKSNPAQYSLNMIFTSSVKETFPKYIEHIPECPTLLQQKIEREVELRVTIVGEKIFAAAVIPNEQTFEVDIRASNLRELSYCLYQLPETVQQNLLKLMKSLGLTFATIDMIVDKQGRHVFIELNIGGQWGWIEGFTGMEISKEIAMWL
ncbi:MvdC/MvdD family ATP grasp protein [Aliikangiella sp. G2MR2-5]|uniref:MvdC/MvdD family ATP grasp protein n=1 Tax=Aliikangiella sp. G2MR2-5 TaxID=2788943 RepID=UPI0018AA6FEE|nr:hypothetical protein [Aliikangiella sp. G2MR2-5]